MGNVLEFKSRPKAKFDEPNTPYAMGFITARQKAAAIVREWALAERADRALLLGIADQIEDTVTP